MSGADAIAVSNNVPPLAVLWPFLLAAGIYLLLRWVAWGPGDRPPSITAARHALWVGIIGWLASSLHPAANAGILHVTQQDSPARNVELLPALAWPVLGCVAVHAIGQLSYPGHRLPGRQAALGVRSVRHFLPRALTWTVLAVFLAAAAQILWTATLPGYAPVPYQSRPAPNNQYVSYGGDGRVPGIDLAVYLGAALVVLAAGTLVVLVLITRRRQLEPLSLEDNNLLRTIAMNRLLRTVATVASGLGAIAGNHAAHPDPAAPLGSWFNLSGLLNLAVLLVMWWWAPPKLTGVRERATRGFLDSPAPAARLTVSIGAAMGLAALLPLAAALLVPGALVAHPAIFVSLSAAAVLGVVACGEILLHRNHGTGGEPRSWPRQPVSPAMLTTVILALALLAAVTAIVAARQAEAGAESSWQATACTSACIAALAAIPIALAKRRRGIPGTVRGLDAALRAIAVHRVARTLAAFFTVQAGVLLLSPGYRLRAEYPQSPGPWDNAWQAAAGVGALLVAAGLITGVIPVRGIAARTVSRPALAAETAQGTRPRGPSRTR